MNILFLTLADISSIKERDIYTDVMREFVKEGHNLFIISPTEKRNRKSTKLITEHNTRILKLQIGNIQKTSIIEKGISTLTLESKYLAGIKKYFNDVKFDSVLYSTPPITLEKVVKFVKQRDGAKTYLLLKDIFPQNAVDLGILKTSGARSYIYRYFRKREKNLYELSDYIGCMSPANVEFLLKNNPVISDKNVEVCPNSIEATDKNVSLNERLQIRNKYNIPIDKTIFIYGGNLGKPQGIDFLIDCIKSNELKKSSYFLIIGSGTEFDKLQKFFIKNKPINSSLLNQLPKEDYDKLVYSCDVGLIFLEKRFTIPNFPSRILTYMQASMPVLAATDVNTDLGKIIINGDFGYWCESSDIKKFDFLVDKLCNKNLRGKLGENARQYLENNYTSKHSYEIIKKHII